MSEVKCFFPKSLLGKTKVYSVCSTQMLGEGSSGEGLDRKINSSHKAGCVHHGCMICFAQASERVNLGIHNTGPAVYGDKIHGARCCYVYSRQGAQVLKAWLLASGSRH